MGLVANKMAVELAGKIMDKLTTKRQEKKTGSGKEVLYDPDKKTPVIRCSICNGEQVGGLKDKTTGEFEEIMVIRGEQDLRQFRQMVNRTDIPKEY